LGKRRRSFRIVESPWISIALSSNGGGQCANDEENMSLVVTRGPIGIFSVSSVSGRRRTYSRLAAEEQNAIVNGVRRHGVRAGTAAKLAARSFTGAAVCGPDSVAVFEAPHRRRRVNEAILEPMSGNSRFGASRTRGTKAEHSSRDPLHPADRVGRNNFKEGVARGD
jgi:hypothetical protein